MADRMDEHQGGHRRPHFARRLAAVPVVLALAVVGCGDDDGDPDDADSDDVVSEAEELAEDVGAYAVAQSLRASLAAQDVDDADRRDVEVLEDAVDDLPGDPEVDGIEDTTGDGRDDDGRVAVRVGDEEACLTVAEDGDLGVTESAC